MKRDKIENGIKLIFARTKTKCSYELIIIKLQKYYWSQ